jgi:hypothetical protein
LLKSYEIINGGSILGKLPEVTELLKEICVDMSQIISRIGNYQNIDQACLNKTVYFDKHRYNILNKYEIINLAHFTNAKVTEDEQGYIQINDNTPFVLHQYDVIKKLENELYLKYA